MARLVCMLSVLPVLGSAAAQDPPPEEAFARGQVTVGETVYPYRLLEPLAELRDVPRPLVVFLHGAGERGRDNELQLRWLPERLATPAARRASPCFVLAVQCPTDEKWTEVAWHERESSAMAQHPTRALAAVTQAIDTVLALPGIDTARLYVTGLSMGDSAPSTWRAVSRTGSPGCWRSAAVGIPRRWGRWSACRWRCGTGPPTRWCR